MANQGDKVLTVEEEQALLRPIDERVSAIQAKIDELRRFESDYRTRLKSYLQNLLTNVEDGGESSISGL